MMRFRHVFLLGGSLLILFSLFLSDPNGGAMTFVMFQQLATPVMAVGFAHLARRALFDYMDLEKLMEKAMETSQGAAVAFAGVSLIIYGLLGLFGGQVR